MVELQSVTKKFGSVTAVDRVSLQVERGEFLTLLGPSGCGKTTLLRMIAGFERPDKGTVLLGDDDVTNVPPYKRKVNQVFQNYALFPHLNVWDNIAFGLRVKHAPKDQIWHSVSEALELVALQGMEKRKPSQLSGGQRQRVALARALVNRPKVLLLDEPLGALDAELRRQMQVELKTIQRSLHITFIFVTHDQEEALSMSDRIAVVNKGRIEQIDTVETIYHQPKTAFVARFLGGGNVLPCEWEDAQKTRVRLNSDVVWTVGNQPASAGKIQLSIRPERIWVEKEPKLDAVNVLQVTVHERLFRGAFDQLQLLGPYGMELQTIAPTGVWNRGDKAFARVDPRDIILVQDI